MKMVGLTQYKTIPKLDLNITNRCNFRCVHCAFDSGMRTMNEFSLNKIRQILIDTKKLGGERIDITGGEPTIRKNIFEIIKIAKSLGYKVELVTNGSLLNKKGLLRLKTIGLDSIAVSLDGSDYGKYSRIRKVSK
ncbi:radical SAM protein, partial [archaeon]|nr:radical SAM protein [archaeon]